MVSPLNTVNHFLESGSNKALRPTFRSHSIIDRLELDFNFNSHLYVTKRKKVQKDIDSEPWRDRLSHHLDV